MLQAMIAILCATAFVKPVFKKRPLSSIETAIRQLIDEDIQVQEIVSVGGGCVSDAYQVTARIGTQEQVLFAKSNELSFLENFQCEFEGLAELGRTNSIGVPQAVAVGRTESNAWLVTRWIEHAEKTARFFQNFGTQLAELHRSSQGKSIGWHKDNFLGAAPQINQSESSWVDFFCQHRIGFQLRWAQDQGCSDAVLQRDGQAIVRSMASLLDGREDSTSLLHGDLWSGNYLSDSTESPVIIDPAVYRGCREAEFGMLRLFGSCPVVFYDAYQNTWLMPDGWQRRTQVYVLYHLLNHLNLFGSGYLEQCKSLAAQILSD